MFTLFSVTSVRKQWFMVVASSKIRTNPTLSYQRLNGKCMAKMLLRKTAYFRYLQGIHRPLRTSGYTDIFF